MRLMIFSVLISFFISILLGPVLIPLLHKLKFGQNIRKEGPESHKKKAGTPTMGGIIFIISTVVTYMVISKSLDFETKVIFLSFIGFGLIGALDDILKIVHKKNEGLKAHQKMLLLLALSLVLAVLGAANPQIGTKIIVPFTSINWNLGIWFVPFIVFYFVSVTNAVNLTDGLDGLSTSVTILVMTFFALISYILSFNNVALLCAISAGALLGFLKYNAYPAQIFMGDTGSLALGGLVAAVGMTLKRPLIIIIVGGIYVLEVLSVVLQVTSFKLTGKRIFKMSPLHHHFELSGWHETKVVAVFSIATVILCLIGFLSLIEII